MKKIIILILLMVSTSVFAEWTNLGGKSAAGIATYADFGTIKRKGHKVKMWSLFDFKTVQEGAGYRYLSAMERDEYDCKEETKRMLDFYWYSGNMGGGEIVYSEENWKMEAASIIPGSRDEALFKIACGKK